MRGAREQRLARRVFDDLPRVHHVHPARALGDDAEVVGDEQDRHPEALLEIGEQRQDLGLDGDVERGGRLVGDQQAWTVDQRHRDEHPLAHPAGELVGIAVSALLGVGNADQLQHLDGALPRILLRHLLVGRYRFGDLVADGEDRVERSRRFLEDDRNVIAAHRPQLAARQRDEIAALEADRAAGAHHAAFIDQPQHCERQHRLAAPRLTHQADSLAGAHLEIHAVNRARQAFGRAEGYAEVPDLEQRRSGGRAVRRSTHRGLPACPPDRLTALGSSASRSASPRRLKAMTVTVRASPGAMATHGAVKIRSRPSRIMLPQVGRGRPDAEAEERQAGLEQDDVPDVERRAHYDGRGDMRQEVTHQPTAAAAERDRRVGPRFGHQAPHVGTHQPAGAEPSGERDEEHQGAERRTLPQRERGEQDEDPRQQREGHVHEPWSIAPRPRPAANPTRPPDHHRQHRRDDPDDQRDARAVEQAREDVAAEGVGAQQVRARWRRGPEPHRVGAWRAGRRARATAPMRRPPGSAARATAPARRAAAGANRDQVSRQAISVARLRVCASAWRVTRARAGSRACAARSAARFPSATIAPDTAATARDQVVVAGSRSRRASAAPSRASRRRSPPGPSRQAARAPTCRRGPRRAPARCAMHGGPARRTRRRRGARAARTKPLPSASTSAPRWKRAISEVWTRARVRAGRMRCRPMSSMRPSAPMCSYSTAVVMPPTGSQPSHCEHTTRSTRPSQNVGVEWKASVAPPSRGVAPAAGPRGLHQCDGDAGGEGQHQRRAGEQHGMGQPFGHDRRHRPPHHERFAEVSTQRVGEGTGRTGPGADGRGRTRRASGRRGPGRRAAARRRPASARRARGGPGQR